MKNAQPPRLAEKFLLLFLKNELAEEVLGDLDEKFYWTIKKKSLRRAKLNYWYQVIHYLRPFAIKYLRLNSMIMTMIKHNFRISYRILIKNKFFSFINIGGLSMGIIVSILIALWIQDELSFDKHHENYDRLVQVFRKDKEDGITYVNSSLVGQVGVFMKETYPTVFERVAMTFYRSRAQLLTVGKKSYDKLGIYTQPDATEMLTLEMVHGVRNGLDERDGIMLSESLAKTFFRDKNPIGEIVSLNLTDDLKVTGVYKDLPSNSTFADAEFMASMSLVYNEENPYQWSNYNIKVYAQLQDGVDIEDASALIKDTMKPHIDPESGPMELFLIPMKDWYLNSEYRDGVLVTSKRMQFIRLYCTIGIFVLLLACINFMNLNTARYQNRSKEVGIRKTVGSARSQLVSQFLVESFLYASASFVISLFVVRLILPWFNGVSDKMLSIPWLSPGFWVAGLLFTILSALIAGSYPALLLSSFKPLSALKGTLKQGKMGERLRQSLVIFQFTISIVLVVGTVTVYNQIQHAKSRPVGYDQEGLITSRGRSSEFYEKNKLLREELKKTGMIEEVATANYPLMNTLGNNNGFRLARTNERIEVSFNTIFVSPEYGKTTKWELVAGRDFSRDRGDESQNIIISESAAQEMGLENPIGERLVGRIFRGRKAEYTIVGVVKDMIKGSPYEDPRPLMVFASRGAESFMFTRIKPGVPFIKALPAIQETFDRILPGHPFNYEFVDDEYAIKFREEERIGSLATLFSALAIVISCLGLFGLSAFIIEQRSKEIGIRKVLGASTGSLWNLLSRNFTFLILISCLISIPLAANFLKLWLENYQYRIEIGWWIYAAAGLSCLLITLATVSIHTLKASLANPVDALRSE